MKKISVDEIVPTEVFESERPERRGEILHTKGQRRVSLGPLVSLLFENRKTVLWQIQEMCRVEHIRDPRKIAEEVEVYNALIPPDGSLSATLLIEITEQKEIKPALDRLLGIDEAGVLTLHIGAPGAVGDVGKGKGFEVPGDFEPGHSKEDKLSAVHYVHFHLDPAARRAFLDPNVPARLVIAHPNYAAESPIEGDTRRSLMEDLRDSGAASGEPGPSGARS